MSSENQPLDVHDYAVICFDRLLLKNLVAGIQMLFQQVSYQVIPCLRIFLNPWRHQSLFSTGKPNLRIIIAPQYMYLCATILGSV